MGARGAATLYRVALHAAGTRSNFPLELDFLHLPANVIRRFPRYLAVLFLKLHFLTTGAGSSSHEPFTLSAQCL
jgi:hypothetical protein